MEKREKKTKRKDRKGAILRFLWIVCLKMRHVDGIRLFGIFPMSCLQTMFLALPLPVEILSQYSCRCKRKKMQPRHFICIAKCVSRTIFRMDECNFVKFSWIHTRIGFNQVVTPTTTTTNTNDDNSYDSLVGRHTHVRWNCQAEKLKSCVRARE